MEYMPALQQSDGALPHDDVSLTNGTWVMVIRLEPESTAFMELSLRRRHGLGLWPASPSLSYRDCMFNLAFILVFILVVLARKLLSE